MVPDAVIIRPTLTLTRGLPSSGKSTWARIRTQRNGAMILDKKKIIEMFNLSSDVVAARNILADVAATLLRNGKSVIIDEHNLDVEDVKRWRTVAQTIGASINFEVVDFEITLEEALRRNASRESWDDEPLKESYIKDLARVYLVDNKLPDISDILQECEEVVEVMHR